MVDSDFKNISSMKKYKHLNKDYHVIPVGIETLGSYGPHALNFIKDIGRRIMDISGEKGPLPI